MSGKGSVVWNDSFLHPLSDLFVVYNEQRLVADQPTPINTGRGLIVGPPTCSRSRAGGASCPTCPTCPYLPTCPT